ncbi:14330_t:CDS:2 [Cetraspora pellucida]|uniref:14330_t:CDS:1 n=1 Tax=Cetraspora pellucida TaxID=1433469 RepID=A0ACA9K0G3_9GLOM|nr:14330_t:CDS:2 [Cetraspora pellucida]
MYMHYLDERHLKSVSDFDLSEFLPEFNNEDLLRMHLEELNYQIASENLAKSNSLNEA